MAGEAQVRDPEELQPVDQVPHGAEERFTAAPDALVEPATQVVEVDDVEGAEVADDEQEPEDRGRRDQASRNFARSAADGIGQASYCPNMRYRLPAMRS